MGLLLIIVGRGTLDLAHSQGMGSVTADEEIISLIILFESGSPCFECGGHVPFAPTCHRHPKTVHRFVIVFFLNFDIRKLCIGLSLFFSELRHPKTVHRFVIGFF
jgi:hypothetical protein